MSPSLRSHPLLLALRKVSRLLLPAAAATCLGASAAQAGAYHVYSCQTPDGHRAAIDDWKLVVQSKGGGGADACTNEFTVLLGSDGNAAGEQTYRELRMPAASTLRVRSMHLDRSVSILPGDDSAASPTYTLLYGSPSPQGIEGCVFFQGCIGIGWPGYSPGSRIADYSFPGGTDYLAFAAGCGSGSGGSCGGTSGQSRVSIFVHSVDMIISDDAAPQASAVTGTLLESKPLAGTATLGVGATDVGAGVYQAYVMVDGAEVKHAQTTTATCTDAEPGVGGDLEFDHLQPCPPSTTFTFGVNTASIPDGAHNLTVLVRDAAGNFATAVDRQITVDNIPAPTASIAPSIVGGAPAGGLRPGDTLVAADGVWVGAGITFAHRWQRMTDAGAWVDIANAIGAKYTVATDDVGHPLRVVVTAKNDQGSTDAITEATAAVRTGATVQTQSVNPGSVMPSPAATPRDGTVNGVAAETKGAKLVLDREQKSVDVKYAAKIVITGRLVDADNQPIANADVDVFEQVVTTAAPWNKIGTIRTDSQGGYVFRPKTTASRRLRFAWSHTIDSADYRATREVTISVTAAMSIKAKRRVVGRRDTIRLTGKVLVDQLPLKGAWVEVQVLDAGVWRTVGTRTVSSRGRWTFKHRLTSSARITFAFRARLRPSGDIASAEARSGAVKVRVR